MKICYIAGPDTKSIKYYSSFLPLAGLGEVNHLSYLLFGDSLYNLVGKLPGVTFLTIAGLAYIYSTYHTKKEENRAKKIERDFKKTELKNKEIASNDILNSSTAQYFM